MMPDVGATIQKDPDAGLVYAIEWGRYLPPDAVITASSWIISEGDDSPPTTSGPTFDDTSTTVKIAGGTAGQTYRVTNRIVFGTSPVQTDDRSFFLKIRER